MKIRDFDLYNYSFIQGINKIVAEEANELLKGVAGDLEVSFSCNIVGFNPYLSSKDDLKIVFNSLNKKTQDEVTKYYKAIYEKSKSQTIEKYKTIKKKTDFIFFDDKDYIELSEVLKDAFYCQATSALDDFMSKKLKSKAVKNIKYSIRLQSYNNISCD